jgi:hypothetical protein
LKKDAHTLAKWRIDMIKLDGCFAEKMDQADGFPAFMFFLNETGHPILYNQEWPWYTPEISFAIQRQFSNSWRIGDDVRADWAALKRVVNQLGDHPEYAECAGPGGWNDPDQIVVGCNNSWSPGLTIQESRTQMSIWSLCAAPLMMSNDLRNLQPWQRDILQNTEVIAIDQDEMGKPGKRLTHSDQQVWARPLNNGEWAIGLFNRADTAADVEFPFSLLGGGKTFFLRDLWEKKDIGTFTDKYVAHAVAGHDTVLLRVKPA